ARQLKDSRLGKKFKTMNSTSEAIIKTSQAYFLDFNDKVTLEELVQWLPTRNVQTTLENLKTLLSERTDLFEISDKGYNNQVMVRLKKVDQYCGSDGSVESSVNASKYRNASEISLGSDLSEDETSDVVSIARTSKSITSSSIATLRDDGGKINGGVIVSIESINKGSPPKSTISDVDTNIIKFARKYLENHQADSVFELGRYLKLQGFQFESEKNKAVGNDNGKRTLKEFLLAYSSIFQVFNQKGITSVRLVKVSTTKAGNSKLASRMKLTENLVKDYISKNGTQKGASLKELIVHLREFQEKTITDELAEFLKNCSETFECDMDEEGCYVRILPHIIQSLTQKENRPFGRFRTSKTFVLMLIRECVMKLGIATYSELEKHVHSYLSNQQVDVFSSLQRHKDEFLFKDVNKEPFIRLKSCDANIICHIRRYLMELRIVKVPQLQEYLKSMDMLPLISLEEFINRYATEYKFNFKTECGVQFLSSQSIDIVRKCRSYLWDKRDKRDKRMSVVGDYLKRPNNQIKLADLLERFPDFQLTQGANDVFVEYKPFPPDQPPADF
ncbi:10886_t:CDS:2, partial [Ambispora leptoticha]